MGVLSCLVHGGPCFPVFRMLHTYTSGSGVYSGVGQGSQGRRVLGQLVWVLCSDMFMNICKLVVRVKEYKFTNHAAITVIVNLKR